MTPPTTPAGALADTSKLPDYGGRPVVRTSISIRNAGDGLSEGLAIDPNVLELGSTVYVVLECVVHAHDHDRIMDKHNDTGLLVLDQVLKAGTGTLIEGPVVKKAIAEQAEKIRKAQEAAKGILGLPFDDPEVAAAHERGEHSTLVKGCAACDSEKAAAKSEEADKVKPISGARSAKKPDAPKDGS